MSTYTFDRYPKRNLNRLNLKGVLVFDRDPFHLGRATKIFGDLINIFLAEF